MASGSGFWDFRAVTDAVRRMNKGDIDVVLILDTLSVSDLEKYSQMLDTLSAREKVCGFVSANRRSFRGNSLICFSFVMIQRRLLVIA